MDHFYHRQAEAPDLPWYSAPPTRAMARVLRHRKSGRALDVGCGSGEHAIHLAGLGFQVTGIDSSRKALELCALQAEKQNVSIRWEQADVLRWDSTQQYDVVFDRGCMHSLSRTQLEDYKKQVLRWLAPGGDLVLVHAGQWHSLDRISIGPEKRSRAQIAQFFGPQLVETSYHKERVSWPLVNGPPVATHGFVFRRPTR